jgi:hypothetical protein
MWEMQINPTRKTKYDRALRTHEVVEEGTWVSIGPTPIPNPVVVLPPYRYDVKRDAVEMLDRLYPDLSPDCKRVKEVKCIQPC